MSKDTFWGIAIAAVVLWLFVKWNEANGGEAGGCGCGGAGGSSSGGSGGSGGAGGAGGASTVTYGGCGTGGGINYTAPELFPYTQPQPPAIAAQPPRPQGIGFAPPQIFFN